MDLVKKYLDLAEAWPGTPEWRKKHDPSYNPYDPEGKQKKALKLKPYGYRDSKPAGGEEEDETPAATPSAPKRGRPKKKVAEDISYTKETDVEEGVGGAIAGAVGQFIGNKIDPVHGEILRTHGEVAGRAAEYTIRKHINKLHKALKAHLSSGKPQMKEEVQQVAEISKSLAMKYLSKAPASAAISGAKYGSEDQPKAVRDRNWKRMQTRAAGAPAAVARVSGMRKTNEEKDLPFTPDEKKKPSAVAGKYGIGYSTARHLARTGLQAALKDLKKGPEKGKRQVEDVQLEEEENAHIKLMNHHANLAKEAAKKAHEFANKYNRKKYEHFHDLADKHVDASYAHEKAAKTNNPQHSKDAYAATKEVNNMAMKEEVEQVSELKTSTVQSYMQKRGDRQSRVATAIKDVETGSNKSKVHSAGLKRAAARMDALTPKTPRNKLSQDEIIKRSANAPMPSWATRGT